MSTTEMGIDSVITNGVGRTGNVLGAEVSQIPPVFGQECRDFQRDLPSSRASFPNTHQPDSFGAMVCNGVPLVCRNRGKSKLAAMPSAELRQPHPRVDLINDGLLGQS